MGTRMVENPAGDECINFYDPPNTPSKIYVYFWGINQCPGRKAPPNLHLFTLYQSDVHPCEWSIDPSGDGWVIHLTYRVTPQTTILNMTHTGGGLFFDGSFEKPTPEHSIFTNILNVCGGVTYAVDGFATIFWLDAAFKLIDDLNLPLDGNTFMEFFMKDDTSPVYKFCNLKFVMNQTILITP